MTVELTRKTEVHNLICHYCGCAKLPCEMVLRGSVRLCHECLIRHQIDILVKGTRESEETPEVEINSD